MFAQLADKKFTEAKEIIDNLNDISFDSIIQSDLSEFVKSFLINDKNNYQSKKELYEAVDKAVKLQLNYTLRPKWTLVNFIFLNNSEARPPKEILKKLDYFLYYSFYTEGIKSFIKENSDITVNKVIVESIFNQINQEIYLKLTTDTTSLKIKNLFLQIFRLKYGDFAEISLNMSIPFSYIKFFLTDKGYDDLLKKFLSTNEFSENTEIELKTIIKILTGKYDGQKFKTDEQPPESVENISNDIAHKEVKDTVIYESTFEQQKERIELPTEIIEETEEHKNSLKYLFKEEEIKAVSKKIFKGDRYVFFDYLNEISKLLNWREATEHLKELFLKNKVNYYDKTVILFVDVLNDYFNKRED